MWVMPLTRWYRSIYMNCVYDALGLLVVSGRHTEAEELCINALRIDPFDETLLEHHLRALLLQGKNSEALDEYKRMEAMFYDVMGVSFSENLRALHEQILRPEIKEETPLDSVLNDWLDGADFAGAYYCDLSVFKTVYQIEARSMSRSGRTAYIVRFDTKHEKEGKDSGVMQQLGRAIPVNLRKGDLFTRASPNQYMLMLHSLTYENCKMLVSRILHTLGSKYISRVAGTSIRPVKPIL